MIKIYTKNPKNPHAVEVAEQILNALRDEFKNDGEIHGVIRNYAPDGRSLPNSRHAAAMLENRCKSLHRDNPGAWRIRELNPTSSSYERGMFRHTGKWEWVEIVPAQPESAPGADDMFEAIHDWRNDRGEAPSYENAESYEMAMAK